MAESKTTKPARLTSDEMSQLYGRVIDIRNSLSLALECIVSNSHSDEIGRSIGVLSIAERELQAVEDMLDPVTLKRSRARQVGEAAHAL